MSVSRLLLAAVLPFAVWSLLAAETPAPTLSPLVLTDPAGKELKIKKYEISAGLRHLRTQRFDLGVLLPNSLRSALEMRLAGAKRLIGYARDGRSLLLSDAIPVPRKGEIPPPR